MANKCLRDFVVLSPLGFVTDAPVPPVGPALREGGFLLTRRLRLALGTRKSGLEGRAIAGILPKGAMRRGDVLVRLDSGEVYAWLKRDRTALAFLGLLTEILDQPGPADDRPVRVVSAEPRLAATLLARISDLDAKAAEDTIVRGQPIAMPRQAANALMVLAIDTCGRRRCSDQSITHTPARLIALVAAD